MDIKIPKLGDGVSSGTVVSILVKEGDVVKKDQTVLEMETEKAVAPIPATEGGTVSKILVKEGDKVAVGQSIMTLSGAGSTTTTSAPSVPKQAAPAAAAVPTYTPPPGGRPEGGPLYYYYQSPTGAEPPASPSIRKMARDLGIDLRRVRGTEHGGRITLEDLKAYIQQLQSGAHAGGPAAASAPHAAPTKPAESIDFSKWGKVTKKQPSSLRKTIGQKMAEAWIAIPHVTQFDEADITELMELRKKYVAAYEKKGASLTVTGMMLKAVVAALKKYPGFNSSLDEATGEIVTKEYYHIGIAVDTEAGLIVPVIRDADKKSIKDLSIELAKLAEKTRQRKVSMEELSGGTFTISNLGSIGGSFFTPIVNKPQVAILGVSRAVQKPVVLKSESKSKTAKPAAPKVEVRTIMPLSLSYDHRVVDGADGARFIREIVTGLENFKESDLKI
jgi:pyruvate dehydrogenase E2 component (dihydrolipoamide acetyltransferase)